MFLRLVAIVSVGLTARAAPADAKPEGDITPLVGEWRFRSMTVDGKATDAKRVKNYRMTVAKDGAVAVYDGDDQVVAGRITKVDTGKTPAEIDWVVAGRSEFSGKFAPERKQAGIFEAGKDTLKMCLAREPAGARPTAFASPEGKDLVLDEFERIK